MERLGFWSYLLLTANHDRQEFYIGRQKVICERGQLVAGRKSLARDTGLHESKIERYLICLENEHQIEQQKTNRFRIIKIKNWDTYQASEQQMNNRCTTDEQQMNTNKKDKNDKNEKNILTVKQSGPHPGVQAIMDVMKECFGTLDDTEAKNRQYAWNLLKKAKMNPEPCIALIRAAAKHDFWGQKITKVEHIYRNAHRIANDLRGEKKFVFIS